MLGKHLKYVREQSQESLAEVSGAVEIDEDLLAKIEAGEERPAEDILLLLISHFDVQENEALQLWQLASYDSEIPDQIKPAVEIPGTKGVVMVLAMDMRAAYSDGLDININQAGLTLNFTQASGQGQATPVARVGMSYEQAEAVLRAMQHAISQAKELRSPKLLPPAQQNDTSSENM
jgi:hypothetical protein